MTSVMWFRRDLRLEDNMALKHAFEEADRLYMVFHVNPEQFLEEGSTNQASFFSSVQTLREEIEEKGGKLHILKGDLKACFEKLYDELADWTDVYINRDEKGYGLERDKMIAAFFKEKNIKAHGYFDHHMHASGEIKTNSGTPYQKFTPYFRKWKELQKPEPVEVSFDASKVMQRPVFTEDRDSFEAFLSQQKELKELKQGTQAAHDSLDDFIEEYLKDYKEARDFPLKDATSHMSHHLRSGEISVRTVYHKVMQAPESEGRETYIQELAWRDFYNMVFAGNPDQKDTEIDENFRKVQWDNNEDNFKKWREGQTGYPIVDAAMRQLNQTGWMHNRLRMITASFLIKDLLIDWKWGERYFQEKLVDYDASSNVGGWQWAASTGTDGVPYFRVFNPHTQSEKYDKDGDFIRQYVPELKNITSKKIHDPSKLSDEEQETFGVHLGEDYPRPIVDHKQSRELAIQAYEDSKKKVQGSKS